ncbi:MAG: hypothetical protein V5A27_08525 [Halapricum sp.]
MPAFQVLRPVRAILAEQRRDRLCELLDETHTDELILRRELDTLQLAGEVDVLPMGEHLMVKATDEFDPDGGTVGSPPCLSSYGDEVV